MNNYTSYKVSVGEIKPYYSSRGYALGYQLKLQHFGLNEIKVIKDKDFNILQKKAELQLKKWYERWEKIYIKEQNINKAKDETEQCRKLLSQIESILIDGIKRIKAFDFGVLKNNNDFDMAYPEKPSTTPLLEYPGKPNREDPEYCIRRTLLMKLFRSLEKKVVMKEQEKYRSALEKWEKESKRIKKLNDHITLENQQIEQMWKDEIEEWMLKKEEFENKKGNHNKSIDIIKDDYFALKDKAIEFVQTKNLEYSKYPSFMVRQYGVKFNNKILVVNYYLPAPDETPRQKETQYLPNKIEFKKIFLSEKQFNKMYDNMLYQICLRTVYEIFYIDNINAIDSVVFNGWVNYYNKATGKKENSCIMSVHISKSEFMDLDFLNVDPESCFKMLKGISARQLLGLVPIRPIMEFDKDDRRFIESRSVINNYNKNYNLAIMDWQDFEHFIRELFERVFSDEGCEVKVTQSSRDGGVDAIAYIPGYAGGKIVIQAKRYVNVVPISAVRELNSVISDEGANKGILVTTSSFGPDAYKYVEKKPIELLDGNNLISILQEHGYNYIIDLEAAKNTI